MKRATRLKHAAVALSALALSCCTPETTHETRVRSALDWVALAVDPAYSFAVDSCNAMKADAVTRFERGSDQARDEYNQLDARCDEVKNAFAQIRTGHARAVGLVEAGKVAEAEAELERVRGYWHVLRERDGGI